MRTVNKVEIIRPELNERIRAVRHGLGLTQEKFSKAIDISISFLAGIETYMRNVNPRIIRLIIVTFNVNEVWFETGEGEMFNEGMDPFVAKFTGGIKKLSPESREFAWKFINRPIAKLC